MSSILTDIAYTPSLPCQDYRNSAHHCGGGGGDTATVNSPPLSPSRKALIMPPELVHLIVNYLDNRELFKVLTLNWTWASIVAQRLWHHVHITSSSNWVVFLITKSVPLPEPDQPGGDGVTSRRSSFPWPTLLPYHAMIQSLHVSLSSIDMVDDLLDMVPCCTELRSFQIESTIPTESLLCGGAIASACCDLEDPFDTPPMSRSMSSSSLHRFHPSSSTSSLSSTSSTLSNMSHQLFSFSPQVPHSQTYSLAVDPCYRTATPKAGIHKEDDETIMASTTSQIGRLFKILTKSCPKLEKLWVSGLQPVSVLGAPTDLRPRLPRQKKSPSKTTMNGSSHGGVMKPLPPIPPVPGMNTAVGVSPSSSSSSSSSHSAVGSKEPVAVNNSQAPHSKIHSIQFVNCTILPQYLLTMILYSLPNLTALHLTQCWRGMPLRSEFLDSLVKICPGLKELTLHATQYHRDDVTPGDLLRFLRRLESSSTDDTTEGGAGALMMKSNYGGPSVCSSTAATTGSSTMSMSMSNSSSSSALATLPSSTSSMSSLHHPSSGGGGGGGGGNNGGGDMDQDHHDDDDDMSSLACVKPSALESISVWFTHQTLTLEIATELADRERHPRLKRVDFGSDSVYDQGETLIQWLHQQRPELAVCAWVRCGDTGDDRED